MTAQKTYHKREEPVAYGKPTIGPRVYLVKGPSGWSESFERKATDAAMLAFLAPLAVPEVIEAFKEHLRLEGARAISWSDVVSYLAHLTQQDWKLIPENVSVAFWAQVILAETQQGAN
jgi:hypothetical protein